ncbi:hypothetical protein CLOM_g8318 [Closterium sp. NIES-68]|nr:hypothetical protein CLOM_g8318 [Closterium sp. NIES-68]
MGNGSPLHPSLKNSSLKQQSSGHSASLPTIPSQARDDATNAAAAYAASNRMRVSAVRWDDLDRLNSPGDSARQHEPTDIPTWPTLSGVTATSSAAESERAGHEAWDEARARREWGDDASAAQRRTNGRAERGERGEWGERVGGEGAEGADLDEQNRYELPHKQRFPGDHDLSPLQQFLHWASQTLLGRPSRGSTHSAFAISRMASQSAANLPPSDSRASSVGSGLRPEGSATLGRAKALSRSDTFFLREMRATEVLGSAVVAPDNGYLLLWQQLVLVLSFYSAFITPLEFSFLPVLPPGLAMADNIINAFFLADLLLTFFVAFKDRRTQSYVCDHWSIATRYLCTFFACDVLALFPWDTFFQLAGGEGDDNLLRWFLWTRVVRTRHVMNYFHRLQRDIRLSYFAVRVVKLIFVELYITHVAGCFFYFLATTYPPDQEGSTWIGSLTLGDLQYTDFRDIDLYTRYFTALYWSVITMATIGYGDVHPVNPREMVFAMVYISFDLVLSAYLVGNITAMVVKGSNTTRYREKMSALIKYMNRNHLPHALRQQMRQHVRLQFETEQVEDEVMEEFPLSIRHKVARALYQRTVEACYLFDGCSGECINQIVARATPEYYYPLEVLIQKNDAADHMFVICSGTVQEASCVHGEGKDEHLATLTAGNMCGEVALLCNILQPFTVTAKELCQVLRIDRQSLAIVTSLFIVDGRRMVDNLLQRSEEAGSKFAGLVAEIEGLVAAQEADLTVSTIYAAWTGDMEQLQQLMAAGAKADRADYDGRTPLHLAAAGGHNDLVRLLLLEGAQVNAVDNFGTTPLLEALRAGHDETAAILASKGGTVGLQEAGTVLCGAVTAADTALLQRLLSHGVHPNATDYDQRSPLHIAAIKGHLHVARLLVDHHADVAARDRWGSTPLDEARRCGSLPLVRFLQEVGVRQATRARSAAPPIATAAGAAGAAAGTPAGAAAGAGAAGAAAGTPAGAAASAGAAAAAPSSSPPAAAAPSFLAPLPAHGTTAAPTSFSLPATVDPAATAIPASLPAAAVPSAAAPSSAAPSSAPPSSSLPATAPPTTPAAPSSPPSSPCLGSAAPSGARPPSSPASQGAAGGPGGRGLNGGG